MEEEEERTAHRRFVQALQHEPLTCIRSDCGGRMELVDVTVHHARIKTYAARCERCHETDTITGQAQSSPPWDEASITMMAEVHLLHDQPTCPYDDTPITFTSLPNPRRKARYRLSCFYCGRDTEIDWPPPEAKG